MKVNIGRFGPYVQIKSEYFSLKTDSPYEINLERALEVVAEIRLAKELALIKDFGEVNIQILNGRFGPYIKEGKNNYKLPKTLDEQDIKALSLNEVQEIIKNQPATGKGRFAKKKVSKSDDTKTKETKKKTIEKKVPAKKPAAKKPAAKKPAAKKPATKITTETKAKAAIKSAKVVKEKKEK